MILSARARGQNHLRSSLTVEIYSCIADRADWAAVIGLLAFRLIAKGFDPSALASLSTNSDEDGVLTGVEQPAIVPSNGHPVPAKG